MDMFSKKPSSQEVVTKDTNEAELPHPVQTTTPTPVVPQEKHSKAFSFVSVLFLIMILAVGVMTYLWYNQMADVDSLNSELTQAKSEQDVLKQQIADLKKDTTSEPATETVTKSDDDIIKEEVTVYNQAYKDSEDKQFVVSVTKKSGSFAWASFGLVQSESGGKCLLKKVDTSWAVLFCGQSTPAQAELDKWGVPKGF